MPAFSFRHVKGENLETQCFGLLIALDLYPVFWDKACEVVEAMSVEAREDPIVDVGPWASRVTLDIIGVAGMGHDFNSVKDPNGELSRCYKRVFSFNPSITVQLIRAFLPFALMSRPPLKRNHEVRIARATIRRICNDLIDEKRAALAKGVTERDILSVALESGGFSNDNLVDQLMTFLAAGHETTASAMLWACYLLCEHRDIQARLRAEVRARLPSPSAAGASKVTSADIDGAPYLNAFCNEALRIFPSVPLTVRLAGRDTAVLGQPIPRGTTMIMSPWAVNVNEELWGPDAEQFNPDRWLDADGRVQHTGGAESNYSFLTFIHGPRSCIGQNFARAEFACLVAAWAGRFEMRFEKDDYVLQVGGGVTAKPKGGLKVKMTPLEGW
jgi:cytochrome P450